MLLVRVMGIVGKAMVILVALTAHDMHTPTNCYLVSLALADLTVPAAAGLPNVSDNLAGQWVHRHAGRLGITYLQHVGINVSSWSIPAFSVERWVLLDPALRAPPPPQSNTVRTSRPGGSEAELQRSRRANSPFPERGGRWDPGRPGPGSRGQKGLSLISAANLP